MTVCVACETNEATTDCHASCECPLCVGCRAVQVSDDDSRKPTDAEVGR